MSSCWATQEMAFALWLSNYRGPFLVQCSEHRLMSMHSVRGKDSGERSCRTADDRAPPLTASQTPVSPWMDISPRPVRCAR